MNLLEQMAKIPHDKLLHSFYGTCIYLVVGLVNPTFATLVVVLVAVAKEIYDEFKYGGFDWVDIVATVALPSVMYGIEIYKNT